MNKEFFEALEGLANECKIPLDALVEKIEQGILRLCAGSIRTAMNLW